MLTLSSIDIKNQEFKKSLRGFDEAEVSAFLSSVATQWQELQDEMRRLEQRATELESKIAHYQRIEEALQQAISSAKTSSAAALDDAKRRAQLIVEEAKLLGRKLTNDAVNENERLHVESARMAGKQAEITARLRAFLRSELELLDHFERSNPSAPDAGISEKDKENARMSPVAFATVAMHDDAIRNAGGSDSEEYSESYEQPEYVSENEPDYAGAADADYYEAELPYGDAQYEQAHFEQADQESVEYEQVAYDDTPYAESVADENAYVSPEMTGVEQHQTEIDDSRMEDVDYPGVHSLPSSADEGVESPEPRIAAYAPERMPQGHANPSAPSLSRLADVAARSESHRSSQSLSSWPSDSEEVMNPNASAEDSWRTSATEPEGVFADENDEPSAASQPYTPTEEELDKIRRILDNLD